MTDWAIPQQAKLKYTQLFNLHDRSHSGFLSGLQCRDILLQSGLPRNVLAEIWNLSDIDGDGQLTREEFILAMHLTNNVRSGQNLPNELPKDLIPPSYRRTRSVSATSVHSTTSASSSISNSGNNNNDDHILQKSTENNVIGSLATNSVLNSNSFEDKRRENFEKGRAELERRRLKIIEQQTGILKEQLLNGKKLVSEAKSKIDALRAERDTKMGMITFLEAQLKTLQDKKAYLNQEENILIAIAKDLNLVNDAAAQAELDEMATQAKQKSINQMKEKLIEFAKEKESKTKELAEVTERLEESKKQLKSISELVGKAYENYREKVANAKIRREQFVNENKTKTVDLDSVWGSAPSFTPTNVTTTNNQSRYQDTNVTTLPNEDPWSAHVNDAVNDPISFTGAFSTDNNKSDQAFSFDPLNNNSSTNINDTSLKGNGFETKLTEPIKLVKKYKALYAFEARNPDELSLEVGDIIVGSDVACEPGWIVGSKTNGQKGLFPEAYVEPLQEDVNDNNNIETITSPILPPPSTITTTTTNTTTTTATNTNTTVDSTPSLPIECGTSNVKYKVIYGFEARNSDELSITPGDVIIGLEGATEPGWLSGSLNGQKGLFPEAYVERVANEIVQDQPGKSRSKRAEVATVIANYRALGTEQLNLEKGQLVLIRRKMDSGWWEGEVQVKGKKKQYGWFPASYVKLLSNNTSGSGISAGANVNPSS